ncbi:bifunctional solanapyrone synthase [Diplogelasinospora grovesii]|uniref:Bifunctional solanapyrone synthase n=1 Tax=Diplogelasinospora grovesii TaxID=303347 RepID=A0AAN6S4R2_9PEZI|nr:bifunctional solanapyrone synthase [Diplogelasinospora grovesii]
MAATSGCIQALQNAIPGGQILLRGTAEYETVNSAYLSGLESDIEPLLIFQPKSKEEVALFVEVVKPFTGQIKCAIRGAGQQPLPGCANVRDGITLDLALLNSINLTDNNKVVQIGAGTRWGTVYDKLDDLGLSVTGSRNSLGGGLSFFSSNQGFIADNVVNYEVVLGSGAIVNANAQENADLWVALRGGGNNLGIVTRFDFQTFQQGPIWGGNVFYLAGSFPGQIQALVTELDKPQADNLTHLMVSIGYSAMFGDNLTCLNQIYYTQAVESIPPVLQPFAAMTPQILNTTSLKSVSAAASEQAASGATAQVRAVYMNLHVEADVATLQAITDIYAAALAPVKSVSGGTFSLTFQPYPVSLLQKSDASGGNVLGLHASNGPIVSVLLLSFWPNKTEDAAVIGFMETALADMQENASAKGTLLPFIYMNYAFTQQDVIDSYGPQNKLKLELASEKYDPAGLFQTGFPGGFKLFT